MEKKITIAIDGFSSTGKSTIAKQIAKKLNYVYVDSGAMYRAVTLYALNNNYIGKDFFHKDKLINNLKNINLSFIFNNKLGFAEMYLNDINVEKEIRTIRVSQFVSHIASLSEVRKKLVSTQREMGENKGIVMDGRDIGTVVFPDAELKLFITASADKRAERRYKELSERGDNVSFEEILKNVQERDLLDSTRKDSPLVKANDAIEIDNSEMGLEEQFELIMKLVNKIIE